MTLAVLPSNPANTIAAGLTGRNYLSYSQITLFQKCPLRWYFEYVEGLAGDLVSASLVFGGAVHEAIEYLYRAVLSGQDVPTIDRLMRAYDAAWAEEAKTPIVFGKDDTGASLRSLAKNVLTAFLENDAAIPDGRIVGVEEELRGVVIPGVPDLLARIDLIVQTDDALVIRDFKTSRSRWSAASLQDAGPQLLLYGELAGDLAAEFDLPVRLEFVVLKKTRSPVVETHTVTFDAGRLQRTRGTIRSVWSAMQAGHVYPNPSPMNCPTCPHQAACRNWRG